MDVTNTLEWIQSIAFFAIQLLTEQQALLDTQINVINTEVMACIAYIAVLRTKALPLHLVTQINVTSFKA